MSDDNLYEGQSHVIRLRVWALGQMVWGAFLAGAFLIAIGAVLVVIWGVGLLLPEQSKEAPSPYSVLQTLQQTEVV